MSEKQESPDVRALRAKMTPVSKLKDHPSNPRFHTDEAVEHQCSLIRKFGWTFPILVDEHSIILAGHKRKLAAIKLGVTSVPVITLPGLTDAEKLQYVVADNQATMMSPWDEISLGRVVMEIHEGGDDVEILGLPDDYITELLDSPTIDPPGEFGTYDETIETQHRCPKCGYEWSGGEATVPDPVDGGDSGD